jgi:spore maturation protein CgeB
MAFIANPTRLRRATVAAIREPVALYGAGWKDFSTDLHERHAHRVLSEHVGAIYRHHFAVLNIRNEEHVIGGLNQRSFDPYLCGAAVVSDAQPDLARCFDPGVEVLVWHDTEELNAIYAGLRRQPALAAAVAERGERRVRHEHTYAHRLATIAALAGVRLQ